MTIIWHAKLCCKLKYFHHLRWKLFQFAACKIISIAGVVVGSSVNHTCQSSPWYSIFFQKYVLLTIISGSLSIILGSLFITIYFVVRNTTTSLHYFETLPTYIPGIAVRFAILRDAEFMESLSECSGVNEFTWPISRQYECCCWKTNTRFNNRH